MNFKNDKMFFQFHNDTEPLRQRPDYGEESDINDELEKIREEDEKKMKAVSRELMKVARLLISVNGGSPKRTAGLYDRLKQDLTRHGPRLMLTLMGDACEKISDELRREGRLDESKAWERNVDLLYAVAKKVRYG
jgi:hypothetical protein